MLKDADKDWLRDALGEGVRFDEPMGNHTSFRIGGPADAWVEPDRESQLKATIEWAQSRNIPYLIIGGGTNLLVRDGGIRGLAIHAGRLAAEVTWEVQGDAVIVSAGAGVPTKHICAQAIRHGWEGMNFALGIPGTLGGAIFMNAGTAHGSMGDVIDAVTVMTMSGDNAVLQGQDLTYRYRRLQLPEAVSGTDASPAVLMAARLRLALGDREQIRRQARQWMRDRTKHQPAWQPCAGCFFKNPSKEQPAGRLIDAAGFKGWQYGGAQVSPRHANFIVNRGDASAEEVLAVAKKVQEAVKSKFKIDLVPEVRIVGEEKTDT